MTPTRTQRVQLGPFDAPLGPVAAAFVHRFIGEAEVNGWIAIVGQTDESIVVTAVRVEPARTVRQRLRKPVEVAE